MNKPHKKSVLPYASHFKVIASGNYIETFQFKEAVGYNLESDRKQKGQQKDKKNTEAQIHDSALSRTRQNVIRLINSNAGAYGIQPCFITFTFAENLKDVTNANNIFTNFMKRLNYNLYKSKKSVIKYLVVIEFQKRGAVHYHAVFFNLPEEYVSSERSTRRLAGVWRQGFVDVLELNKGYEIALYLGKYLTKHKIDQRLVGRKRYFPSRGLFKPTEYTREKVSGSMLNQLVNNFEHQFSKEYESKYSGLTRYRTFVLSDEELEIFKSMYNAEI